MTRPTLDQALQVARDLGACGRCSGRGTVDAPHCHGRTCEGSAWPERTPGPRVCACVCERCNPLCRTCGTTGVVGELSPDVVTWLAKLAQHHPQVSAAVAAALPTSGVRWGMPWSETQDDHGWAILVRAGVDGKALGRLALERAGTREVWGWMALDPWVGGTAPTEDAARAEVDERLLAAGYTLLGAVYRRAPTVASAPSLLTCEGCGGTASHLIHGTMCGACGDRRFRDLADAAESEPDALTFDELAAEVGRPTATALRSLADAAERDMPTGLLAGPPERCGAELRGQRCVLDEAHAGLHIHRIRGTTGGWAWRDDDTAAVLRVDAERIAGPPEEYPCTRCTAGPGRVWGTTWDTVTTAYDCPHCDGTGMVRRG